MIKAKEILKRISDEGPDSKKTYDNSINALKTVYYVIIGLAITEALNRTFTKDGTFIGREFFNQNTFILMLAFMLTICRFTHGASIHLGGFSRRKQKAIIDFVGFIIQGSLFYIMAIALDNPPWFLISFEAMLLIDVIWLMILKKGKFITMKSTENQWFKSDVVILVVFAIFYVLENSVSSIKMLLCILLTSFLATIIDYRKNWEFYFPKT